MNIKETIANISRMKWELETALEENGGELTPELLEKANALEDLKALLADGGIDELGRWLKSVQDETAALKAEADAAARRVKNSKSYEDYVKGLIGQAMDALCQEKIKGAYYGFTRRTSTTNKVNQEAVDNAFLPYVNDAVASFLPPYIHIELKTTATELIKVQEPEAACFLETTSTPALGFTKPRANNERG